MSPGAAIVCYPHADIRTRNFSNAVRGDVCHTRLAAEPMPSIKSPINAISSRRESRAQSVFLITYRIG